MTWIAESDPGAAFIAKIRGLHENPERIQGQDLRIYGARGSGEHVVVVYREVPSGPLHGRYWNLTEFRKLFDPSLSLDDLAYIAYADDMCDPSGPGTRRETTVADDLVEDADDIGWLDDVPRFLEGASKRI